MDFNPLTELETEILISILNTGANGPTGIAKQIDRPEESVSRTLSNLQDRGLIMKKSPGVWDITTLGIRVIRSVIVEANLNEIPIDFPHLPDDHAELSPDFEKIDDLIKDMIEIREQVKSEDPDLDQDEQPDDE